MNYSILIIDDEEDMTTMLATFFRKKGFLVRTANDSGSAFDGIAKKPDLILLDINMPDMDGLEFCRQVRSHVNCPILFLSAKVQESDKINGLMAGGDDYITKPFSLKELAARVDAHLRRDQRSAKKNAVIVVEELIVNMTEQRVEYKGEEIPFSKKEFDLLSFLAINRGQILDKEHIYEEVWDYDAAGDSSVVKEHVRKIRKKLMEKTGRDYIETVWGMGYRMKGSYEK